MRWLLILVVSVSVVGGCGDRGGDGGGPSGDSGPGGVDTGPGPGVDSGPMTVDTGPAGAFTLTSTAYAEGGMIPTPSECGPPLAKGPGMNISPPLSWTPGPAGTMSYAIVFRDLDFDGFVHWVIYDIPPSVLSLPEGVPAAYMPIAVDGARQAELQRSGYFGYFGPCSPGSVNTYQLTVHAIPTPMLTGVTMSSTESEIAAAVEAQSIASASLSGES